MRRSCTPTREQPSLPSTTAKPRQQQRPRTATKKKRQQKLKQSNPTMLLPRVWGLSGSQYQVSGRVTLNWNYLTNVNQRVTRCMVKLHCIDNPFPMHCDLARAVQFSSVAQWCPTLCDPMDCSTAGLPVHHPLLELAQTHVH